MPFFGKIIVIKRNGTDGTHFPLTANSCLFGRKKECDIRIQLPQVSKEHCKIEVNENKEATLINLSAANPTKLNGSYFQHPTCLKHEDVLTIIDRSFRFEYPPLLVHRKRHSTSQEKETLQVLHIQQVDQEELLHPQNSDCKSPQSPDKLEQEGQNIHGSDNKKPKEHTTRQYVTPESIHKTCKSNRKNETSPFTQLYYLMKNEDLSNEIPAQQTECALGKDNNDCLAEITTQTPHRRSAYMKTEAVIQELADQSKEIENQDLRSVCSLVSVDKTNTRNTLVSLQTCSTEKKQESEEATDQVHFQDIKENDLEKAEALKSDANLRANKESAKDVAKTCCIVSLEYSDGTKSEQSTEATDIIIKSTSTNTFESEENSLPTSKSKEKSIQVYPSPNSRGVSRRSSSKSRMLPAEVNSLDIFSSTESSAETEGSSVYVNGEDHASGIFNSSIHFETKENNFTERPLNSEILKETNYLCSNDTNKDGNSRITACSPCLRRSPRRSLKQNKDLANRSYFKEMSTEKVSLETPTSVPPGSDRMKTPHQLSEQTVGVKRPPQKRKDREGDLLTQPSGKRKRVSFGGHLSPELFDKRLPPNSPLKRGAIPATLSLPFGNSPRAVLKKTSELRQSVSKEFSEIKRENILSKKAASPPARRSPTASPPARRSPTASPPARRSPTASPPARRSPTASPPTRRSPTASPPARRSPTASPPARRSPTASPASDFSCNLPQRNGRFSVSLTASFSSTVEHGTTNEEKRVPENVTEAKNLESSEHGFNTSQSKRRSKKFALKRSSVRRSGTMDVIHSKRRSGASEANLIVAKSWADVVKQGVPKSQLSITTKRGCKRPSKKITSKQLKSDVAKTPTRKVKGYFTTGHANSPAPIVIGKAHTRVLKMAGQAPKVMLNYPVKQDCNLNESFTGVTDMFNTPPNWKEKISMCSVDNTLTPEGSALQTSENSGEMTEPSFTLSSQQRFSQYASPLPQISNLVEDRLQVSPGGQNTEQGIEEIVKGSSLLETAVNETLVGVQQKSEKEKSKQKLESEVCSVIKTLMRTPRQKPEPVLALSGVKRLMRTPKAKPEPVDALSAVKRFMRTPKAKPKPVEALSAVKRLMRTPKAKPEPVEALSAVKSLMRTPKAKPEPVEALSTVKRPMRTPKAKPEPDDALSTVKRLMRTPKAKPDPDDALSAVKRLMRTPKTKPEPVDALSAVKTLMRTPKAKSKPIKALSGVNRLMRTPKAEPDPVEALSGVKSIMRTPKVKPEPVEVISGVIREEFNVKPFEDEPACSIVMETPYVLQELQGSVTKITPRQRAQSAEKIDVSYIIEPPKEKLQSVENTEGIVRLSKSPKQRFEALEEIVDISRLSETPRQMFKPMDENLGLQNLIAKPDQSFFSPEVDYNGIKEMLDTNDEHKVKLQEGSNLKEEHEPDILSRSNLEFQPVGMDLQSGTIIDFEKTAKLENPAVIDSELLQPLASTRQTRRGKGDKSTSTEGSDTKKTRRCARNILHAKSTKSMQTNESSDQNITEPRSAEESEKTKRTRRGKSRQCSSERNTDKDDSVMQTQEPSKETSGKVQQSVKKRGAAKAGLNSKQTASPEESGRQLITKTLRSRNKKDDKNELKSEFTQINPLDKMQCKDLEHLEMELINQTTTKEKGRKGKGRKVCFLLEKHNSVPFEENYMIGDESAAREEKGNASFESSATSVKEMVLRRSKRKAPTASLSVCTSSLRKGVLTKRCEDEQKEGINLPLEHTTVLKDSSGSAGFAKEKHSQEVQTKDNPNEILENVQIPVEDRPSKQRKVAKKKPKDQGKQALSHELSTEYDHQAVATETQNVSKGQKVKQGYSLRKGGCKYAVSDETETKYDKEITDTKDQNMVVKTAFSAKENPSKRGRERKVAPVSSQTPFSPLKNDHLPVHLPSTNCKSTEVDHKVLETTQFGTANVILSRRGRRKKIEDIPESSVSTRKRSRLLDNENQEKVSEVLQGVTKDNVCKRGRRHLVPYESSAASNGQPGNGSKEAIPVNEKVPSENSFGKENQPKRGRRKNNFLASQEPSSLKVSFTLPSVPSEKGETANEDQSMLIKNGIGEEKIANTSERNDKLVPRSTRRLKPEKIFQEKQNVDLEKTAVSNEKQSRRGRRKLYATEATVSQKEKCGLTVKGGTISKDQHIILENTMSDLKGASKGTQQKVRKGENLPNTDASNSDQNSNLGHQILSENGNGEKEKAPFKRGKQKRVNSEPESSVATSDKKKIVFTENNSSNPSSGNIESTTLQRGKKKRKEHQTTVVIQPTDEMESKTRAGRRIKK